MAYFLKKANQKNDVRLAIYESFYSQETHDTKHRCIKSLGSVSKLKASGIDDPINHFSLEVKRMNEERAKTLVKKNVKQISNESPRRYLGYYPLANILNTLDVEEHFNLMQSDRDFQFSVYDVFTSLVFARVVSPCSKSKTFHDVLPCLFKESNFSYDQMLSGIDFIGSEYKKFNEILTTATRDNFGLDTSSTYFDCTNFYFEIDRENEFQAKGPSKENRKDPIVGLGLLLDKNLIPIGMRMYPGNQSEKPVIRNIISDLKKQNNIKGKTIQVADKGLNCSKNILEAKNKGDGYLFSKSVKQLKSTELKWVLLENDYKEVLDNDGNISYRYKSCIDNFEYSYVDDNGVSQKFTVTEKRVCTYNPSLAQKQLFEINKMIEKAKGLSFSKAKKSQFGESSKYVTFMSETGEKAISVLNEDKINRDRELAGYNLLVTSEINISDTDIYSTYHNLWAIEQSFRIMKSELDARPVYLQLENRINGHFFICYTAVLLSRLLQFKVLKNRHSISQIFDFIRDFGVVKYSDKEYINTSKSTLVLLDIADVTNQPITNYYLTDRQIKLMHTK